MALLLGELLGQPDFGLELVLGAQEHLRRPVAGAHAVEVPNPTAEMVIFRELIEAHHFQSARAALPIASWRGGRPTRRWAAGPGRARNAAA